MKKINIYAGALLIAIAVTGVASDAFAKTKTITYTSESNEGAACEGARKEAENYVRYSACVGGISHTNLLKAEWVRTKKSKTFGNKDSWTCYIDLVWTCK